MTDTDGMTLREAIRYAESEGDRLTAERAVLASAPWYRLADALRAHWTRIRYGI